MSDPVRIQRALAAAGVASRRAAERMVAEGRVLVNDEPASIGQLVGDRDVVTVDGRRLAGPQQHVVYVLNKPFGTITTASDPQGRRTALAGMPAGVRLFTVGRLDMDSAGVLLVTNDGELAHRLMHPRYEVPRVYEALVDGAVSATTLRALRAGVELEDGPAVPRSVDMMRRLHPGGTWLRITLTEGRNREVRRMCAAVGHPVVKLVRVAYAGIRLQGLRRGEYRLLTGEELAALGTLVGLRR